MNIVLLLLLALVAFILIRAALLSPAFTITQSININRPVNEVFDYVKYLKNSDHFNKWVMTDPNMKKDYKGTDGTVGFVYSWDSNDKGVGKGEQEIIAIKDQERLDWEIRFVKPFEGKSLAYMTLMPAPGSQTTVTWAFENKRDAYMMKVMHVVLNLKKVLSKDMATSLQNLKKVLEGGK